MDLAFDLHQTIHRVKEEEIVEIIKRGDIILPSALLQNIFILVKFLSKEILIFDEIKRSSCFQSTI